MSTNLIATVIICALMVAMLLGVLILVVAAKAPVVKDRTGRWSPTDPRGRR